MFGESWSRERHVIEAFEFSYSWQTWRALDDGFSAPAWCLWLTKEPDSGRIFVVALQG
jgi:hypothetical protein